MIPTTPDAAVTSPAEPPAVAEGTFVSVDLLARLGTLAREEADACAFGIVRLDDDGTVRLFNRAESEMTGVPAADAEGRHYFSRVVPCTNNPLFFGTFRRGVAADHLNVVFPWAFVDRTPPVMARIHLYRCPTSRTNWLFTTRG